MTQTSTLPSPKEQARTEIEELMRDNLAQRAKNRDAALVVLDEERRLSKQFDTLAALYQKLGGDPSPYKRDAEAV